MPFPQWDWSALWWQPYAALGQVAHAAWARTGSVSTALAEAAAQTPHAAQLPRFVPQSALPPQTAYEQFIFEAQQVPTRDNLHDFFNGLMWLHWPHTKWRLNALQYQEISAQGVQAERGPVRDALTLFDENAAIWLGPPSIPAALAQHNWQAGLIEPRPQWEAAAAQGQPWLVLFGHALLEKLVQPYKSITAHVFVPPPLAQDAPQSPPQLDAWLATQLHAPHLATKPFAPLPVLGVPLWWPDNAHSDFYNDAQVFRPKRPPRPQAFPRPTSGDLTA